MERRARHRGAARGEPRRLRRRLLHQPRPVGGARPADPPAARGRRTPLLRGPDRGRGGQGARRLGRHREVPDQQGDGPAPARPGPHRRRGVLMSNALRDVLERHAHDVDDVATGDRLAQVHGRVTTVKRRRRAGGSVLAAVVVAALAVGLTVLHRRPARPAPRTRRSDPGVHSPDRGRRGQRRDEFSAYFDVPTTDLRVVYSCPEGEGSVAIAVEGHDLVKAAPCDGDQVVIDRRVPGWCSTTDPLEAGDMVELTMPGSRARAALETATDSDGTRLHVDVLERIDPRTPRAGDLEVRPTWQESPDDAWELSEVEDRRSGRAELHHRRRPDVLVTAAVGYDVPLHRLPRRTAAGPAPRTRRSSTRNPTSTPRRPRAGGRFTIRLDQEPEPDGVLGFVVYTRTNPPDLPDRPDHQPPHLPLPRPPTCVFCAEVRVRPEPCVLAARAVRSCGTARAFLHSAPPGASRTCTTHETRPHPPRRRRVATTHGWARHNARFGKNPHLGPSEPTHRREGNERGRHRVGIGTGRSFPSGGR